MKKNKGPIARKKGLTINWTCISQSCSFRATTVEDQVEHTTGFHHHPHNVEKFHKRESRVKLKAALTVNDISLTEVVHNFMEASKDEAELGAHGSDEAVMQCARRFKLSQQKISF